MKRYRFKIPIFFIAFLWLAGCSQEPAKIHYGNDECVQCKMMITDSRFASQLVTEKGKAYKFDSIECLVAFQRMNSDKAEKAMFWVNDFGNPGHWLKAEQAQYVKSEVVQSPMGESLLAFANKQQAQKHLQKKPGKLLTWNEVKSLKMEM